MRMKVKYGREGDRRQGSACPESTLALGEGGKGPAPVRQLDSLQMLNSFCLSMVRDA